MIRNRRGMALGACLILSACAEGGLPPVTQLSEPEPIRLRGEGPPDADPELCYSEDVTPAVIETVTHQVVDRPAKVGTDGEILSPATYRTETVQEIVEERRALWFEVLCQEELTPEFVATVQRALEARGFYRGPIDGEMSPRLRRAIRAYQKPQGLDSAILSMAAARQLGLIEVKRIEG